MSEPTLFQYAVTVKGNLDNGASVHGTIFSHKKLSQEEINAIKNMRFDDAVAYCCDVLHGKLIAVE